MIDVGLALALVHILSTTEDIARWTKGLYTKLMAICKGYFPDYDLDNMGKHLEDGDFDKIREYMGDNTRSYRLSWEVTLKFLDELIDEKCDALMSNCQNYCDICAVAISYDIEDMGEINDGAFTEETMWDRIRYEISRECYWHGLSDDDKLGEYFDSNFEEPPIEYQEVRTPCWDYIGVGEFH